MKIKGAGAQITRRDIVALPRPDRDKRDPKTDEIIKSGSIILKVTALNSGFNELMAERIPEPEPTAYKYKIGLNGKKQKDSRGVPIQIPNEKDPAYCRAFAEYQMLQNICLIVEGLKDDTNISFDSVKTEQISWRDHYIGIRNEMDKYGFGLGDIVAVARKVQEISAITPEEIEDEQADFLSETEPE